MIYEKCTQHSARHIVGPQKQWSPPLLPLLKIIGCQVNLKYQNAKVLKFRFKILA